MNDSHIGFHTLTVKIFDAVQNSATDTIDFNYLPQPTDVSSSWKGPTNIEMSSNSFPLELELQLSTTDGVNQVRTYIMDNGSAQLVSTALRPANPNISINLGYPGHTGSFEIYSEIESGGVSTKTSSIQLKVN